MSHIRLVKIIGVVLAAGLLMSCGAAKPAAKPGTGNLITLVTDVPICNAISASMVIENLSFSTSQGATEGYITTTPSFAPEIRFNLEMLRDFTTVLYQFPVTAGTYTQANFDYELGQMAAFDPTLSPPIHNYLVSFTNSKPLVALNPPLVITPNQTNVMVLDYNALQSLDTDSSGNLTGNLTPVVTLTQLTDLTPEGTLNPNGFTEIDDLWGFVRSVSTLNTTSNPTYQGSFQMQLLSPSTADAPEVAINITPTTNIVGFSGLNHLLPDTFVEVDTIIDSQGNFAAKTIEAQEVENPFPTQSGVTPSTALIGPIVSIKTDAAGNPIQLDQWVRDAEPDDTSTLLMDNIYQVDLTVNPSYQASIMGPNFANLSFGPLNLSVGQEIIVHGAYTKPATPTVGTTATSPYTVEPTAIFLNLQSMQGTMNSMLAIGSDNLTGAFILTPCCQLLQGVPLYVVTNNQTNFVNVTGLEALTSVQTLVVQGMPYYEPKAVTINGATIPAGALVVQAKQVHVLL